MARLTAVLAVSMAVLAVAGCSGSNASPTTTESTDSTIATPSGPVDGGTLDIAVAAAPSKWAPNSGPWTTDELQAARAVYDRLMVRDSNDQPVPELLSKASANSNFTSWTLVVREGVIFSDGSPLTSEIVAFNLRAQQADPSNTDLLAPISAITTPDAQTVVVSMFTPWSTFPQLLTTRLGTIAAPSTLLGFDPRPIGTGPFVWFGVDEAGITIVLKNSTYWKKGLPHLDAVRFLPIPEAADRVTAALEGKVGMVAIDEPRQLQRLEAVQDREGKITIHDDRNAERPKVNIAFETGRAPFDRITARRAVALATDRAEILSKAFAGQGSIARGMVSDTEETGVPLTFRLLVAPGTTLERVASLLRGQLAEAGIDMTIDLVDPPMLSLAAVLGQFQAILQVGFDSSHPDAYEPLFRGIPAQQSVVSGNPTRYISPLVTKSFLDARTTADVTRQVDDYGTIQEQVAIDIPYLFLVQVREVVVTTPKLRDVTNWSSGSGSVGLGQDDATVSLAQMWLAR